MPPKANLVVQDTYHLIDTDSYIQLSPYNMGTLTTNNAAHEHWAFQFQHTAPPADDLELNVYDLVTASCWHDHVADIAHPYQWRYYLDTQDCYHVLLDEDCAVNPVYYITLGDGLNPNLLPHMEFTGQSGERANLSATLPDMRAEGTSGASLDADLPDLESEGMVLEGGFGTVDAYLTYFQFQGYDGCRADRLKLPGLEFSTVVTGGLVGTVDVSLPGLELDATLLPPIRMDLDVDLPPLRLSALCGVDGLLNLDAILPTLKAVIIGGVSATLDAKLPTLIMDEAEGISGDILTLSGILPTLITGAVGTGVDDGEFPILRDESRFTDYVLRYARFR
jgi:hypothetical protein